jgi:CheY-like chemotaxis protein
MPTPDNKAYRILVVDDEPVVCDCVKRMLTLDGHVVDVATGGTEALARFEVGKFDLVILDYEMPSMKGDELALLIKTLAPRQPVIMVTAYPDTLATNLLTDVDLIMSKPFKAQELREAAAKLFPKP